MHRATGKWKIKLRSEGKEMQHSDNEVAAPDESNSIMEVGTLNGFHYVLLLY
jgi:hypothetical protein